MLTRAFAAISRVDAPSKPRVAKIPSAAARIRVLVEAGASLVFLRALGVMGGHHSIV